MKKLKIITGLLLLTFAFSSCSKDDENNEINNLPITIDFHQVMGKEGDRNDKNSQFSYVQQGLKIQTIDATYHAESLGRFWLYPGTLKISNINSLKGLKKIAFKWRANNTSSIAFLYDIDGKIIEKKTNVLPPDKLGHTHYTGEGNYVFEKNLEKASYLTITGLENTYSSIIFE